MKAARNIRLGMVFTSLCIFGAACSQSPVTQHPPGTIPSSTFPGSQTQNPAGGVPSQPAGLPSRAQMNDSYRWAHAVETAHTWGQLGAVLGGPFGGPASMGMGLLGLIYGRMTADAEIAEEETRVQTQVQKEVTKDQQLEAAIEKELERQRAFEMQVAGATETAGKNRPATELSQLPVSVSPSAANSGGIAIASVAKPAQPQPPPAPFKNVEVKDLNNDGIADLWIYYNPQKPGEISRQEESSKGNGSVDTWSYFNDGKLVRRDVDSKGFGRPDTIYYYDDQKIVREERDENGQGRMTYRADYQDGRLAKVERDSRGSGRPDSWIVYDTSKDGEVVLKEERDLDGDGLPDTWSYYEQGRLIRRDVSRAGREILSKQEGLPLSSGAIRQPSIPGS